MAKNTFNRELKLKAQLAPKPCPKALPQIQTPKRFLLARPTITKANLPETYQGPARSIQNYVQTNQTCSQHCSKIDPKISQKASLFFLGRPWGEVLEPTSGHSENDLDFESILEPLGLPGSLLGGPWWEPFSPLALPLAPPRSSKRQF